MKPTTRRAARLALFACLLFPFAARSQAPAGAAVGLSGARYAAAGTVLGEEAMVFNRGAYEALQNDYTWQERSLGLKARRLAAAARLDTTTSALLAQAQGALGQARADNAELHQQREDWKRKWALAYQNQRPPLLLDRRLYLGAGIGLGLGALGAAYLLLLP